MLDETDFRILEELSMNSRITMKELGEKVHLTGQATSDRVAKLQDNGVIDGYTIKVNLAKLGCFVHVFITIQISSTTSHKPFLTYIENQKQHIINKYKISGEGCYLLECKFPSNQVLDEFLEELNRYANYKLSIVINK